MKNAMLRGLFAGSLLSVTAMFGQGETFSASETFANGQFEIEILKNDVEVIVTFTGPENLWLAFAPGSDTMISGNDVIMYVPNQGNDVIDREFAPVRPFQLPPLDDSGSQDWEIVNGSIQTNAGQTTVSLRRDVTSNDPSDYDFSGLGQDSSLTIAWAMGNVENEIPMRHSNRGPGTISNFTLGVDEVLASEFSVNPNPVSSALTVSLPQSIASGDLTVFDYTGKVVATQEISTLNTSVDMSGLSSGMYLVKFAADGGEVTKKLMKI